MTKSPTISLPMSDPHRFALSGTEHGHQVALFAAVAQYLEQVPELKLLHAIPNGGTRGDDKKSAMIAGATMKAEGVKPGVSDIMLPVARWNFHGLYIEMKKPGGVESPKQIEWGAEVMAQGYWYQCCDHWAKAFVLLMNYLQFSHDPSLGWMILPEDLL